MQELIQAARQWGRVLFGGHRDRVGDSGSSKEGPLTQTGKPCCRTTGKVVITGEHWAKPGAGAVWGLGRSLQYGGEGMWEVKVETQLR